MKGSFKHYCPESKKQYLAFNVLELDLRNVQNSKVQISAKNALNDWIFYFFSSVFS